MVEVPKSLTGNACARGAFIEELQQEEFRPKSNSFSVFQWKQQDPAKKMSSDSPARKLPPGLGKKTNSFSSLAVLAVEHPRLEGEEWKNNFRRGSITHSIELAEAAWGSTCFPHPQHEDNRHFILGDTVDEASENDSTSVLASLFFPRPAVSKTPRPSLPDAVSGHLGLGAGAGGRRGSEGFVNTDSNRTAQKVHRHFQESQQYHPTSSLDKWRKWIVSAHQPPLGHTAPPPLQAGGHVTLPPSQLGHTVLPSADKQLQAQNVALRPAADVAISSVPGALDRTVALLSPASSVVLVTSVQSRPTAQAPAAVITSGIPSVQTDIPRNREPIMSKKRFTYRELNMTMPTGW